MRVAVAVNIAGSIARPERVAGGATLLEPPCDFPSVDWCENQSAALVIWPEDSPGERFSVPFKCRSWRHAGNCRLWKGAQDFVRVSEAIRSKGDHWVFIVLTLDQKNFRNPWEAYRSAYRLWQKLNQRLTYRYGPIDYLQTLERHEKGFPHLNVVLHNEKIWEACAGDGWRWWRQVLKRLAVKVGFGYVLHVHPLWSGGSLTLAGYITKLSRELTGAGIKNQIPVNAPKHFRRLRASRGLLPPVFHGKGWTGFFLHPERRAWMEKRLQSDESYFRSSYPAFLEALARHLENPSAGEAPSSAEPYHFLRDEELVARFKAFNLTDFPVLYHRGNRKV